MASPHYRTPVPPTHGAITGVPTPRLELTLKVRDLSFPNISGSLTQSVFLKYFKMLSAVLALWGRSNTRSGPCPKELKIQLREGTPRQKNPS